MIHELDGKWFHCLILCAWSLFSGVGNFILILKIWTCLLNDFSILVIHEYSSFSLSSSVCLPRLHLLIYKELFGLNFFKSFTFMDSLCQGSIFFPKSVLKFSTFLIFSSVSCTQTYIKLVIDSSFFIGIVFTPKSLSFRALFAWNSQSV